MADLFEELPPFEPPPPSGAATRGTASDLAAQQAAIYRQRANAVTYKLEHWDDPNDPWDNLYLGADLMPGIWEVASGEAVRQIDTKKVKEKDSAVVRDLGGMPVKFSATGHIITREQWRELQRVLPNLNPRTNGGIKNPVAIYHPAVALLGVTTVYITRVTAPRLQSGILEISIEMTEWSAPKPTKVKPPAPPAETPEERAQRMANLQLREEYDKDYLGTLGKNLFVPKDPNSPDTEWRNTYDNSKLTAPPSTEAAKAAAPVADAQKASEPHGGLPEIIVP